MPHHDKKTKPSSAIINVNGKIISPDLANVSVYDRSFLYGDSLYEVVRTYQGQPFRLKDHLLRLQKSAKLCRMQLDQSLEVYEHEIMRTLKIFQTQSKDPTADVNVRDAYIRIVVSRGSGHIGFGLKNITTQTQFVIYVEPIQKFKNLPFAKGMKLQISKRIRNHPRALDPAMKSGNYLNNLLAYLDATKAGFDDALLVDQEGFLTEGTTFNLFYVRRGIVATPPLDVGILDGITRRLIVKLCVQNGIPCREVRFTPEQLMHADEVFITSSLKEVFPIGRIDQKTFARGRPGAITLALHTLLQEEIQGTK